MQQESQLSLKTTRRICAICNSVANPLKHAPPHIYLFIYLTFFNLPRPATATTTATA